eukprot:ANDGO_02811.mRNA.1 Dynein regulatory complex subunit 3
MDKIPVLQDFNVINDDLLRRCVYVPPPINADSGDQNNALAGKKQGAQVGGGVKGKPVDRLPPPEEIEKFTFSFCNLHEIKNLGTFKWVTMLQLDNNHIHKIDGLQHMVNLRWLDLSFNNIAKIENLHTLVNLCDLTLYGNQISHLEGMEKLLQLECLSIGKNNLEKIEEILYLRRYKKLRMLTIAGNPLDKDPEHRSFCLAHCPGIKYLDYKLVDAAEKVAAKEAHEDLLFELDEKDRKADADALDAAKNAAEDAELAAANVSGLGSLLESLITEDPEYPKIRAFEPLYEEQLTTFKEQMTLAILEIKTNMLAQLTKKRECTTEYEVAVAQAKEESDSNGKDIVKQFEKLEKRAMREILDIQQRMEAEGELDEASERRMDDLLNLMRDELKSVQQSLLDLENILMEQIENVNLEYIKDQEVLSNQTKEIVQSSFLRLQDLENIFAEKQFEKAFVRFEQAQNDDAVLNEYDDVTRQILSDKDVFTTAFTASHDNHVSKLNAREETFQKKERSSLEALVKAVQDREYKRNRSRVQEIWSYCDSVVQKLEALANQLLPEESG